MNQIAQLAALADQRRLARVLYRRPLEDQPCARVVEPYQLLEENNHYLLHCWQVAPEPPGPTGWRTLRIDRITHVADGGASFVPRCVITLRPAMACTLDIDAPAADEGSSAPSDRYAAYLEQTFLNRRFDSTELEQARALAAGLLPSELRTVHGRVFASVAQEILLDQEFGPRSPDYLGDVRNYLCTLGWSPA